MKQGPVRFECEVCGNKIITDWREIVFYNKRKIESLKEVCSYNVQCDVCRVIQVKNILADEVEGNYYAR